MKWKWVVLAVPAAAGLFLAAGLLSQAPRASDVAMPENSAFRLLLGVTDTEPTNWDGKVTLEGGRITAIQGWRFAGNDSTDYRSTWKLSTRRGQAGNNRNGPMTDNGVVIISALESAEATFKIDTPQGSFQFAAREVPYGESKTVLNGRATVERVPATVQLTTSAEDQDHPAIARSGDDVWLAYVDFTHGDRESVVPQFPEEPKSLDFLARPTGGDRIRLVHYTPSKRIWGVAEDVTPSGQDIMRAAVAVDGRKRVWVIWSAQRGNNFDLYAKYREGGKWSAEQRVTTDTGTDINPVAATDSTGRVWIAWQAFRGGNLDVLAAAQEGNRFGAEQRISFSSMSDWDPAIAAGTNGEVAISFDTYDKGDYDVYLRRMRFDRVVRMDAPVAVAASQNFEARSSIAFDPQNRIWVSYEASDTKWGKDFGAYETTGIGLYQGLNVRVKCIQGTQVMTTADSLTEALPGGRSDPRRRRAAAQQLARGMQQPNPALAGMRAPSATPQPPPLPKNSFARIAVDPAGIVYLAYRTSSFVRSPVGTVWNGHVVYFDGQKWNGPIAVPHTDGLLDVRAALMPVGKGDLLLVSTTDHRQAAVPGGGRRGDLGVNADLYAAEIRVGEAVQPANMTAALTEVPAPAHPEVKPELDQVAVLRNHRVKLGREELRLVRGEFHRHTEFSGDGGNDGSLIDAYRYMIDAAYMDWGGCCDHDNGGGREYFWWTAQKLTDAYLLPGKYTSMFSHERSVRYPEGHRNAVFARRGIRPLPRLRGAPFQTPGGSSPDTRMLYRYLRQFDGIVASHTSGTNMGTDWRDNDPVLEPVVEIYQGDRQNYEMPGAPRTNTENDSIGGWQPLGFVSLALEKGYRLGFQASSDHISTHMSYCNLWVTEPTREAVLEAFKKRRIYGATENILADVRSGGHFMGEEFSVSEPPAIHVRLTGTANFAKVHIIKDGKYAYAVEPGTRAVDFTWRDSNAERGKTSYYYVRGEQSDGELVWVSPMWITYK